MREISLHILDIAQNSVTANASLVEITVEENEKADKLSVVIGDNGKGMSKETIEKILSGTYREERLSTDSNGVAMDNVIARLRLFTGNDKVLDIFSEGEGMGTEFVIYLKQIAEHEKNQSVECEE
jgi:sensor histidine kinase YesM